MTLRSSCIGAVMMLTLILNGGKAQELKTLHAFGVSIVDGYPVYPLPSNVALGLFDPDPLLDLAYFADGKVQVWMNLGDGTFGRQPVYERNVRGEIAKMQWQKSRMWTETIFDKNSWSDLVVTYAVGSSERISHEEILNSKRSFASLPQTITGFPPLNFHEVWQSGPNSGPGSEVLVGDIDDDGKTELVYMFYPATFDSIIKLVVYECVGNDSFVVDWDTTVTRWGGVFGISDLDKDGHKEIVTAYFPRGINILPTVALLECFGPRKYRFYNTNIGFQRPIFGVEETDIDHDGVEELTVLTSDGNAIQDPTLIYVAEFAGKSFGTDGWLMAFNQQLVRFQGYAFDMAIGQLDGQGWDEIVPAGGSFGFHEPVPVSYLWYSGIPGPSLWKTRSIYTGLESGTGAVMFANLDADTMKEFISGAPGPIGHGSMFALKYLHDTTWTVMWADSSLRNAPLWVNAGTLSSIGVVAGANTYQPNADTTRSWLNVYRNNGIREGVWFRDSASIQQFHFANVDNDNYTDLIFAQISIHPPHFLKVFETVQPNEVEVSIEVPAVFSLGQNYPNPFNPATKITFSIPQSSMIQFSIYDVLGKEVKTNVGQLEAGMHTIEWNTKNNEGGDVSSGVYFYRIIATDAKGIHYSAVRKMILIR